MEHNLNSTLANPTRVRRIPHAHPGSAYHQLERSFCLAAANSSSVSTPDIVQLGELIELGCQITPGQEPVVPGLRTAAGAAQPVAAVPVHRQHPAGRPAPAAAAGPHPSGHTS